MHTNKISPMLEAMSLEQLDQLIVEISSLKKKRERQIAALKERWLLARKDIYTSITRYTHGYES